MAVTFVYDEDKDIQCLIEKGSGSINSPDKKTKTYEALLAYTTEVTNVEKVREFVRKYISDNSLSTVKASSDMQHNWNTVSNQFENRAEKIFGIRIPYNVTAYMTVAGRFPYSTKEKYFYVSLKKSNANAVTVHELMHFYTWELFKEYVIDKKISDDLYNDIKESFTVLLNIEFKDLLNGEEDVGYPQHAEMRAKISRLWNEHKDIKKVFERMIA